MNPIKYSLFLFLFVLYLPCNAAAINVSGSVTLYDAAGEIVALDSEVTGYFDFSAAPGSELAKFETFGGGGVFDWFEIFITTLNVQGNQNVHAEGVYCFSQSCGTEVPVIFEFEQSLNQNGSINFTTLDGNGDGIPGFPIFSAPFPGSSLALNLTSVVPIPPAIWLFMSGLSIVAGLSANQSFKLMHENGAS